MENSIKIENEKHHHTKQKSKLKRQFNDNTEAKIDKHINKKLQVLAKLDELDDDEYDLNDDKTLQKIEDRDKLRISAFKMECEQRKYVIFDDAEISSIDECFSMAENPIIIYDTDLEPLNQMLTTFINTPGGYLGNYLIPEFDDVKEMLEDIREEGQCLLYEQFVPKVDSDEYVDYILKILGQIREKIQIHRSINYLNTYCNNTLNVNDPLKPSTTLDDFAEKLKSMKSEGQIVKEEEPAHDDFDDLEILLDDDSKSETPSEVRLESKSNLPTHSKENIDLEIIALDEDNNDLPESPVAVVKNMDCASDNESSDSIEAICSKHSDDCIAAGESAISPIDSPKEANDLKSKIYDDDDIICID